MVQVPDSFIERAKIADARRHLTAIVDSSDDAIVSKSVDGIITSWNRSAQHLFGYTADEVIGKPVTILIPPDRQDEEPNILRRIRSGERVDHFETIRRHKDGTLIDISLTVSPVCDAAGKIVGASKIARNITERKQARARQELLAREIQHRTKNLFAVVHAVVARSCAGKKTVKDAEEAILSRLHSLAETHVMLLDKDWRGADIADIVRAEMSPYAGRVVTEGPSLAVAPKVAQNLGLAVHELATNAAKYGALSNSTGQVHISWSVGQSNGRGQFTFRWQERGGPPVTVPTRKGFGSAVLEQVMTEYVDVSPQIEFAAHGISYELTGALDLIASRGTANLRGGHADGDS